jgi:hypothetical protein
VTLPDAIYEARTRAARRPAVIARAGEHAYQVRFTAIRKSGSSEVTWEIDGRRWLDQRPTIPVPKPTSARGTLGPFVGWSRWSRFLGFGVEAVLATDWNIIEKPEPGQ